MNDKATHTLMRFLSTVARQAGVAEHCFIVGGAVRNHLLGVPAKDLDVVVDSVALKGRDSEWFAREVAKAIPVRTSLTTNQYGVAILALSEPWELDGVTLEKGETIEIANARKESYGGGSGKGYKPHMVEPATIREDLVRREFTFNSLLWRLSDLTDGPEHAEVLDLLGTGRKDLEDRIMRTPVDPDKTFSDDATRMLRALKFIAKYGFRLPPDMAASIRKNAPKLKGMPWDAVRKILVEDILEGPNPRRSVGLLRDLGIADVLREMLIEEPGFASALGRSLSDKETLLVLDLLDLDWAIRTPVSFLGPDGLRQLRVHLLALPDREGQALVDALRKPPIRQPVLFERYNVAPKDRGSVVEIARHLLLGDPSLMHDPSTLEGLVGEELASAQGTRVASENVVRKFLAGLPTWR